MKDTTTVQLRESVVRELKAIKKYLRQTYNEVIMDFVNSVKGTRGSLRGNNHYDEFLHAIQQQKMKELWDNEEDDAWENAKAWRCRNSTRTIY